MAAKHPKREQQGLKLATDEIADPNAIFARIAEMALQIAVRSLRYDDAMVVAQDVALTCWQMAQAGTHSFGEREPLEPIVFALAKNKVVDWLRAAERGETRFVSLEELHESAQRGERAALKAQSIDMDAKLDRETFRDTIVRALAQMPDSPAEVFRLIREEGLSKEQVAALRGVSVNTVKTQLQEAQYALRAAVAKFWGDSL